MLNSSELTLLSMSCPPAPAARHISPSPAAPSVFAVSSPAFGHSEQIPRECGYKNGNVRPGLRLSEIPDGCRSVAVIMDDPDALAAVGKVWVHWTAWNMPPDGEIPGDALPQGAVEGLTDFGQSGYGGPAPPDKRHTYVFCAYALDTVLHLPPGASRQELDGAMKGHVLAEARLEGTYAPDKE